MGTDIFLIWANQKKSQSETCAMFGDMSNIIPLLSSQPPHVHGYIYIHIMLQSSYVGNYDHHLDVKNIQTSINPGFY